MSTPEITIKNLETQQRDAIKALVPVFLRKAAAIDMFPTHDVEDIILSLERAAKREGWFCLERRLGPWPGDVRLIIRALPSNHQYGSQMTVELSWSSTNRNIAEAVDAIASYQRALELGAYIQGMWNRR